MKKIIFSLAVLLFSTWSFAQCDKKVSWHSIKTELIDASGQVADTKDDEVEVLSSKTEISVKMIKDEKDLFAGTVKESTCEWKEAYKNGKTVLKAELKRPDGEGSNATITIEGKDGTVIILIEIEKMEGRKIKVYVDKFEEKG